MSTRIAVVYYSATGNVYEIAQEVAQGAMDAGAEVRLRQVAELAPDSAIDSNPAWRAHRDATADVPVATLDDLSWADGYAFGSPTRFGNVAAQLKQFIDTTGPIWRAGHLSNKAVTGFTSSGNLHGGQESTLLALYNMAYHWGAIIVPTGYVDYEVMVAAGGNPYGLSCLSEEQDPVKRADLYSAARSQGARLATAARALTSMRAA
jgi:NAD(P)H dehydrogenase (quinone)